MRLFAVASLVWLAACASAANPARAPSDERDCCVFVDTARLPGDFVWRQRIGVSYGDRHQSFQAVIEKQGGRLVLLALSPLNTRVFALEQVGVSVKYIPFMAVELPFSPRYILADVHRTFFRGLSNDQPDGVVQGVQDGERITESWSNRRLMRREYASATGAATPLVVIDYVGGMQGAVPPREIRFENRRYGYELTITTLQHQSM